MLSQEVGLNVLASSLELGAHSIRMALRVLKKEMVGLRVEQPKPS